MMSVEQTFQRLALALLMFLVWTPLRAEPARPNIVLIMADDLGYGDLGCYGSRINRTPHIDRLAADGLRFTDFHSAGPMCTPTRAATLTGLYQQRFGSRFDGALSGQNHTNPGLPLEAITIAEVLQKQGYATGCFGKWHLGYIPPWLPPSQGFEEFVGLGSGDGDHHTHIDRWGREDWWNGNQRTAESGYTAELLTKHAAEFLQRHQDRPMFLYVPHLAIHFPWQGPDDPPHRQPGTVYTNDKWGIIPDPENVTPHVTAMVEAVDRSVGEIVAAVERLKLTDNTLVLFTSDNGGYLTYGATFRNISSNGPLRDQKGSIYEGGHRVPMIAHWPGRIVPGVTDQTANSIDLFPTFSALAGVTKHEQPPDGVDLTSLLIGGTPLPERMLFWRIRQRHAVRSGPWKLCVNNDQAELYNLDDDLGEQHDLAAEHSEVVNRLSRAWSDWQRDVNESAKGYVP